MLAIDKIYHIIISGFLVAIFYIGLQDVALAAVLTLIIGMVKELWYDLHLSKGNSEILDMLANTFGVAVVTCYILLIEFIR